MLKFIGLLSLVVEAYLSANSSKLAIGERDGDSNLTRAILNKVTRSDENLPIKIESKRGSILGSEALRKVEENS